MYKLGEIFITYTWTLQHCSGAGSHYSLQSIYKICKSCSLALMIILYAVTTSIKYFFLPVNELRHIPKIHWLELQTGLVSFIICHITTISRHDLLQKCVYLEKLSLHFFLQKHNNSRKLYAIWSTKILFSKCSYCSFVSFICLSVHILQMPLYV